MTETHSLVGALNPLVGYHLRRASAVFAADFAAAVEGTGMRQVLIGILAVVAASPGINQGAVGRILGIKRANMVSLINELIDAGMIVRETDPTDRRAFTLTLSPAGTAMLDDCTRRIEAHEDQLLAGFSAAEKAMLLDLLGRIEKRAAPTD
ncbi:MarR family winged helix-turn-helix transcriptional regulator [Sphingomonas floccifaciens]|uniref:MarR family winged helix-turn-helix transcriptional regulator n=1 Tax=Sphingomonas floccifaciens TaxID=1844115 RepID=A0ABW4ND67_9SPHN